MATNQSFVEGICAELSPIGEPRYRKMFGEYMVYLNDKPVLTVCDNTAYVKKLDQIADLMSAADTGLPYPSAKEHYILDFSDPDFCRQVLTIVESITPLPKKRAKKS